MSENDTLGSYECPEITEWQSNMIEEFGFYVEGIFLCIIGNIGIIINLISSIIILTRKEMRNCFNILLVGLAAFDTWYLFGAILESCRKYFPALKSDLHVEMFPKFLYPVHQTSIAGSIFMTVAIAFERYTAVHYPMNYNQAMNDQRLMRSRVIKYLVPVSLLSFGFNIPKFFESKVEYSNSSYYDDYSTEENDSMIATTESVYVSEEDELEPYISLTELRTHPTYSLYNSWSRFFILGLIPFCSLVFFNSKIYRDIKERKRRRMINNLTNKTPRAATTAAPNGEDIPMVEIKTVKDDINEEQQQANGGAVAVIPSVQIVINEATSIIPQPSISEGASSGNQSVKSLKKTKCSVKKARNKTRTSKKSAECCLNFFRNGVGHANGAPSETLQVPPAPTSENGTTNGSPVEESHVNGTNQSPNSTIHKQKKKDIRRKNEDSLAMVFMIIILIFLVCHAPRIILDINELATIKMSEYCASVGKYQYSFWSIIVLNISHFLLVVNSSVNMIVYCLLGSRFRAEVKKIIDNIVCWINDTSGSSNNGSPQTNGGIGSNNNA